MGQDIVDAFLAARFCEPEKWPDFTTFLSKMVQINTSSLGTPLAGVGASTLTIAAGAALRRSPRRPMCKPVPTDYHATQRGGNQSFRHHKQVWCAMCKRYKTQTMCARCKVGVCRSGAKAPKDLSTRTCWEDHIQYGLPVGRGAFRVGEWALDHAELVAGHTARPAKQRRASTGMLSITGNV